MPREHALTASQEDYVEAIANISGKHRVARVKDISETLGVSKASVTGALRSLASKGLVNHDPYGLVTLTNAGESAARRVVRRHTDLARFLEDVLGLDASSAEANACRIEHVLDAEVFLRLRKFVEFVATCPLGGEKFTEGFKRFFESPECACDCGACGKVAVAAARQSPRGR